MPIDLIGQAQHHVDHECRDRLELIGDAHNGKGAEGKSHIHRDKQDANAGDDVRRSPNALQFFMLGCHYYSLSIT